MKESYPATELFFIKSLTGLLFISFPILHKSISTVLAATTISATTIAACSPRPSQPHPGCSSSIVATKLLLLHRRSQTSQQSSSIHHNALDYALSQPRSLHHAHYSHRSHTQVVRPPPSQPNCSSSTVATSRRSNCHQSSSIRHNPRDSVLSHI